MSTRQWISMGTLLATVVTGAAALAQDQQRGPMRPGMHGMMGQHMMGWGMHGMGHRGMGGPMPSYGPMMEGRLAYLRAELGITDTELEAWNGYASAVKARASAMQGAHATMMQAAQSGSAVERLDAHIQTMQSMIDSLKALKPATETLYNALSDQLKKKADLLLGAGCCTM